MADDPRVFLERRKSATEAKFGDFRRRVAPLEELVGDFATVYVTGSFGRGEASETSDLDVFILTATDGDRRPRLTNLNAIRL